MFVMLIVCFLVNSILGTPGTTYNGTRARRAQRPLGRDVAPVRDYRVMKKDTARRESYAIRAV